MNVSGKIDKIVLSAQQQIRTRVSPQLTKGYAKLGFANRDKLCDKLKKLPIADEELLLDRLASRGILKTNFREEISSLGQIDSHMLSGRTTVEKLEAFSAVSGVSLSGNELFADRLALLSTISTAIVKGSESVYHQLSDPDCKSYQWTAAIAKGTLTAAGIATALVGLPWFMGDIPNFSPRGVIFGAGTGLGLISALHGDRLPVHSLLRKAARLVATKILPLSVIGCGVHLIDAVHDNNMNVSGLFESVGLETTVAYAVGSLLLVRKFVSKNIEKFRQAYTGMLDPGQFKHMNRLVKGAGLSIVAEAHFLATFTILVGAASLFLFPAVYAVSPLALIPFAIPVLATGAHVVMRTSRRFSHEYSSAKLTKFMDHLKIYLPYEGLFAGYAASFAFGPASWLSLVPFALSALGFGANSALTYSTSFEKWLEKFLGKKTIKHLQENLAIESVVLAATASIAGIAAWPTVIPIAYFTFFGSLATLMVSQAHGIGHSINTNKDELALLRCSGRDPLGENEIRNLVGSKTVLLVNPYTALNEHAAGLLFNLLLARKPKLPILCMHDKIPTQLGFKNLKDPTIVTEVITRAKAVIANLDNPRLFEDFCAWIKSNQTRIQDFRNDKTIANWAAGSLPNLRDFTEDRHLINYAIGLQRSVHKWLDAGIGSATDLDDKYRQLITNLEATASYYENELFLELQKKLRGLVSRDEFDRFGSRGPAIWQSLLNAGLLTETANGVAQLQKEIMRHDRASFARVPGLLPTEHDPVFDLLMLRLRERRWFEMWNPKKGTIAKAAIPAAEFDKIKHLFEKVEVEPLEFRQDTTKDEIMALLLPGEVTTTLLLAHKDDWFVEEINEYLRAASQDLLVRAGDFRETARRLQTKLDRKEISEEDLQKEWAWETGCFDPDTTYISAVGRKEMAGDEWKVRKVENVATPMMLRGLTIYKVWSEESKVTPTTDWVGGNWTRVYNPNYRKGAAPGTLAASKFVWVEADLVLTNYQKENREYLSTSPIVAGVNNEPDSGTEGFVAGNPAELLNFKINNKPVNNYYYVTNPNQRILPQVKNIYYRDGRTGPPASLPSSHKIATIDRPENLAMTPVAFTIPLWDHALMVDKNDIQVDTYRVLPAIVTRESQHLQINFIYQQPFGSPFEIKDPHPDRPLDTEIGLQLYDANVELSYEGRVIPLLLDRAAAPTGRDESVNWKKLSKATVSLTNGQVTAFTLFYEKNNAPVIMPPSTYPRFIASLGLDPNGQDIELGANNFADNPQREGDMTWAKITYTDGTCAFVRFPDGKRPNLMNKDRI